MSSHNRHTAKLTRNHVHSHGSDLECTSCSSSDSSNESDMEQENISVIKRALSESPSDDDKRASKLSKPDRSTSVTLPDNTDIATRPLDSTAATWSARAPVVIDDTLCKADHEAAASRATLTGSTSAAVSKPAENEINFHGRPMFVYIEGQTCDIAKYVKLHIKSAQSEINDYLGREGKIEASQWLFQGKFLRITCNNIQQVKKLLAVRTLGCQNVKVTLPRSVINNRLQFTKAKKSYIVFGIGEDTPLEDLLEENNCTGKELQAKDGTYSVLLTPNDDKVDLPYITIAGCVKRKTNVFYPHPLQCVQCWAYGHSKSNCGNRAVCQHCAIRGHTKDECRGIAQGKPPRCANCKGSHESDDKTCPKYLENRDIKRLAVDSDLTFPAAKIAWQEKAKIAGTVAGPITTALGSNSSSNIKPATPADLRADSVFKHVTQRLIENMNLVNHYMLTLLFRVPNAFDTDEAININAILHDQINQNVEIMKQFHPGHNSLYDDIEKSFALMHEYQDACLGEPAVPFDDTSAEHMDVSSEPILSEPTALLKDKLPKKTSDSKKIKHTKTKAKVDENKLVEKTPAPDKVDIAGSLPSTSGLTATVAGPTSTLNINAPVYETAHAAITREPAMHTHNATAVTAPQPQYPTHLDHFPTQQQMYYTFPQAPNSGLLPYNLGPAGHLANHYNPVPAPAFFPTWLPPSYPNLPLPFYPPQYSTAGSSNST